MRVIVFFDLPVVTSEDNKNYRIFRKRLFSNGFIMMQESVYCKLVLNDTMADMVVKNLRRECPPKGKIQVLKITEKQYARMEMLVGEELNDILNTDEKLVIL